FLEEGAGDATRWKVPLQVRAGTAAPENVLLTGQGQRIAAGGCQEPLTANAGAVGYYRVQYDPATLPANTRAFGPLPDADRIAMLDDQWALVQAHGAPLGTYLALAERMGASVDSSAWQQINNSLGVIEHDERGSAGHDAFAAYARSVIKPLADRLGW